jgi:hypothetical protein
MGLKTAELVILLKDKMIFYVNIEEPDNQGSTIETEIEDQRGIYHSVEGNTFTFKGNGKTAFFTMLDNALIIVNRLDDIEVIVTFAENGGLQIKSNK